MRPISGSMWSLPVFAAVVLLAGCKKEIPEDIVGRLREQDGVWRLKCPTSTEEPRLFVAGDYVHYTAGGKLRRLRWNEMDTLEVKLTHFNGQRMSEPDELFQCGPPNAQSSPIEEGAASTGSSAATAGNLDICKEANEDKYERLVGIYKAADNTLHCVKIFLLVPDPQQPAMDEIVVITRSDGGGTGGGSATGGPRPQ